MLKFEHGVLLFAAAAAAAVFAISNENNAVSVDIGYFVLENIKLIELFPAEFCGFSFSEQKNHLLI